jgi:hypothetical protein
VPVQAVRVRARRVEPLRGAVPLALALQRYRAADELAEPRQDWEFSLVL